MPQHPVNRQEACSYAILTSQALPQRDAGDRAAVEKKHISRLESGFKDATVDLPPYIKDKVTENDIGRMYTEDFLVPRASLAPPTRYIHLTHVLGNQPIPSQVTYVNGHCHSHSSCSRVAHLGTTDTEAKPDIEATTEDSSSGTGEQYSFQYPAAGPKGTNWRYDLRGIGAQFPDSEFKEYVVCY